MEPTSELIRDEFDFGYSDSEAESDHAGPDDILRYGFHLNESTSSSV